MPLITLGIVIDDDAFLEISSKKGDILCQLSLRREYLNVRQIYSLDRIPCPCAGISK